MLCACCVRVVLVLVVVALSWLRPLSDAADAYVDEGLKRSLISFASARALNGVISVLQGTQVAVSPLGFGVSLTVGEALDPINDLIPVCPNCHAMLHRRIPPYTPEELKNMLC